MESLVTMAGVAEFARRYPLRALLLVPIKLIADRECLPVSSTDTLYYDISTLCLFSQSITTRLLPQFALHKCHDSVAKSY